METDKRTWAMTDHLCSRCGGRILVCVTGRGPSPGGNPLFMCADCEAAAWGMGPDVLCWCGQKYRNGDSMGMTCVRTDDDRLSGFPWGQYGIRPGRLKLAVLPRAHLRVALGEASGP